MSKDLNFDGGEISILKAIGTGGGEIAGETLMDRVSDLEEAELIDTLKGLISLGFVECDKNSFHNKDELSKANFHVNSGYARDIRDALDPKPQKPKSKRVRRE
jgi:hypothetical protein